MSTGEVVPGGAIGLTDSYHEQRTAPMDGDATGFLQPEVSLRHHLLGDRPILCYHSLSLQLRRRSAVWVAPSASRGRFWSDGESPTTPLLRGVLQRLGARRTIQLIRGIVLRSTNSR